MGKLGIVVLLDAATDAAAYALARTVHHTSYTLCEPCLPHLSLAHVRTEHLGEQETLQHLERVLHNLPLDGLYIGMLRDIRHKRAKWVSWDVEPLPALMVLQAHVRSALAEVFDATLLETWYPFWAERFDPHVTLAAACEPLMPEAHAQLWVGLQLAVVEIGTWGEVRQVLATRDLFAPQVELVLTTLLPEVVRIHATQSLTPEKAIRKHDQRTPYGVHPMLCATAVLHERTLDPATRLRAAIVLACHDLLEDTHCTLPAIVPPCLEADIVAMSFESSAHEMAVVWSRSAFTRLCKLYDKWSNLYDASMSPASYGRYCDYARRLSENVLTQYPHLVVHHLIRATVE